MNKMHVKTPTQSLPWRVVSIPADRLHVAGLALGQFPSGSELRAGTFCTDLKTLHFKAAPSGPQAAPATGLRAQR